VRAILMTPARFRLLASAAAIALLAAALALVLLTPATRPSVETPFVSPREAWPPVSVPLMAGNDGVYRLSLYAPLPAALLDQPEVRLFFSVKEGTGFGPSWLRRPALRGGTLRVAGTPCVYETAAGAALADGRPLAFVRGGACSSDTGATGEVELALVATGRAQILAQAFEPPSSGVTPAFLHAAPGGKGTIGLPILRGVYVDYPPGPTWRRIDLLNYMWQIAPDPTWLGVALGGSAGLALTGLLVFPMGPRPPGERRRFLVRSALSAACLAGSLGIAHTVLNPPLFAPDEPYHLLAYASLIPDPSLDAQTREWMMLVHVQRIRFTKGRFLASEVGRPYTRAEDPHLHVPDVRARSSVAAAFWSAASHLLRGRSAPPTLLALRLLNALAFALAVGAAAALATALTAVPYPQLLSVPFLLVPALPYLATHLSEVAALCPAYVVLSTCVVILFLDGPRAHWVGLPLGLAYAVALAGGRQAWPLAALVSFLLATRVLLGTSQSRHGRRDALVFWLGLAAGGGLFQALARDDFRSFLGTYFALLPLGTLVFVLSTGSALLPFVCAFLLGAIETWLHGPRRRLGALLAGRAPRMTRAAALALAALVALSFLLSLLVRYPELPGVPVPNPYSAWEYSRMVLASGATTFRLTPPDYLTWSSFWAAFGWLHFLPPTPFLSALLLLNGLCLIALLLHLARAGDGRRLLWLLAIGLGALGSLAVYALALQKLPMNVNGRYLVGWHLSIAAVIWSVFALARRPRPAALLALCGAGHAFCLGFVLWRFF
jgi:hypothetical protein